MLSSARSIVPCCTQRTPRCNIGLPTRRQLRISRKVRVRREADRQVLLNTRRAHTRKPTLLQKHNNRTSKVIEEDDVDSVREGAVGGEGDVGLEVVGLRVVGDGEVDCVVAVGAEVVGCGVARGVGGGGLAADDAAAGDWGGVVSLNRVKGAGGYIQLRLEMWSRVIGGSIQVSRSMRCMGSKPKSRFWRVSRL